MKPDRRPQISDLYHAALERAPEERVAFLKAASDGDEALRQEVESLLDYESATARFLERPAAEAIGSGFVRDDIVGRQVGPYKVVAPLGAGGMGEVYRAHDSKLGRDVAIKILPPHFTADPERRARFAREARLLATLNHPHIGAIYGLEETDGVTALVLELVEGPTLANRLERGPLSLADAMAIARQIAEALDAAHQRGIVHRDLKPANIVLQGSAGSASASGDPRAKVLDFGLAKMIPVGTDAATALSTSFDGTVEGRILGTPTYMSPEQARGETADKRTDIWAFGCVLFEMLSGRRAFEGKTTPDTLARILEREPDWSALPRDTPPVIRALIERCLRKDPQRRLHDIADARIEIDEREFAASPLGDAGNLSASARIPRRSGERVAWIVASSLLALALVTITAFSLSPRVESPPIRYVEFSVEPPENARFRRPTHHFAVAPDGGHLAFIADDGNHPTLWVRPLGTLLSRMIPGTRGATSPFWSSDSRQIGFFADGKLKTVPLSGGVPFEVCDLRMIMPSRLVGATWNRSDVILFGSGTGTLEKISATSGARATVTALENGIEHRWPSFLPDGQHFLYMAHQRGGGNELRVGSLDSTAALSLGPFESTAIYASGHLLFRRGNQLVARTFDLSSLQMHGDPLVVAELSRGLFGSDTFSGFSISDTGVLAYSGATGSEARLTWRDRNGRQVGTVGNSRFMTNLDLSLDGKRVAVASRDNNNNFDIWLMDLARAGDGDRLTTDPAQEFDPAWSPDGRWIAFHSSRTGTRSLFRRASDRSGEDELLFKAETGSVGAPDWSPDGRFVLFSYNEDLWVRPLTDAEKPAPFKSTEFIERQGVFSPSGRSVAFASDLSGRYEIYVSAFPSGADKKVSLDGGIAPRWSGDGKELFFLSPDSSLMAARVTSESPFTTTIPQPLFVTDLSPGNNKPYAVAKDGQRFLMPVAVDPRRTLSITVGLEWTAKVRR